MSDSEPPRATVQVGDIATAFLDSGEGETIVALHGIPTSSRLFSPLLPLLDRHRLIAPDLLGQGLTAAPPTGPLDHAAYAGHLRGFLSLVPPARFHLLIHDLGGVLGLDWAAENADRVKTLTILSTTITESLRVGKLLYGANLLLGRSLLRWGMESTLKRPRKLDPALMDEWIEPWTRRRVLRGMDHFAGRHLRRIRGKLDGLRVPTRLIWGAEDNIFPMPHASAIAEAFPKASLCTIPRCGHWSTFDAPDEVARLTLEHLE